MISLFAIPNPAVGESPAPPGVVTQLDGHDATRLAMTSREVHVALPAGASLYPVLATTIKTCP